MFAPPLERKISLQASLSWRGWRGPADYQVLADIGRRANLADHVAEAITADSIANDLEHPINFSPPEDVLIGEIESRPVAWQRTQWRSAAQDVIYMLSGFVSPGWRRRGIGRELLRRGERRLRQVAAGHLSAGARPQGGGRYYSTFTPASRVGKVALFQSEGYEPVRHFYTMLRTGLEHLPEAPLPAGLELRPALPEHWRAIWDANEEAFRDHWSPMVMTEEDYQRWLQDEDFDPSLWQIAWDTATNQVAGVSLNVVHHAANAALGQQRGWVDNFSVRRPWRQRGLGRALLLRSLRVMRERGQTEVALGVDAQNPTGALRLYEGVGFKRIDHAMVLAKPMELKA